MLILGRKYFFFSACLSFLAFTSCRTTKFGNDAGVNRPTTTTPWPSADATSTYSPEPSKSPVPTSTPNPAPTPEQRPESVDTLTSLQVTPPSQLVAIGMTATFKATANYSLSGVKDVTAQAAWSSQNAAIALSMGSGAFKGKTAGTTQVAATFGGQSAVGQLSVPAGVVAVKVGVNFEDHPFSGDNDFNDAVLCFTGKVAVSANSVTSLIDQSIRGVVTKISSCDHDMVISLSGPGTYTWSSGQFRTSTKPGFDIPFKAGSVLNIQFNPISRCGDNNRVWVNMYNKDWAQLLVNECKTTGR